MPTLFFQPAPIGTPVTPNVSGHSHVHAKLPASTAFTMQRDPETGLWYRPTVSGFGLDTKILSEDNLNFIKVLHRHGQLDTEGHLTRASIETIVKDLDYDSDLWDDIYDNNDIFRSVYSEKEILDESPRANLDQIHRAKMKKSVDYHMQNPQRREFRSDGEYRRFVTSRINVFKFYIYLRRCAILYRDTEYKAPLINLLHFLELPQQPGERKTNYDWLKDNLRVLAMGKRDENWNSGLHEWLTCDQTMEALLRTAGLKVNQGVESHLSECIWSYTSTDGREIDYPCSEFNWLDLQLLLRTPNKYVIFKSRLNTPENGHCGAVNYYEKPSRAMHGKCTGEIVPIAPSENAFHDELNTLLGNSPSITHFVRAIHHKYNIDIFHDDTPIQAVPSERKRFLVDGTPTDSQQRLEAFKVKLVEPHHFFYHCEDDISTHQRIIQEKTLLQRAEIASQPRL